jgi:DNA-binding CsgD family transcriptional regulator
MIVAACDGSPIDAVAALDAAAELGLITTDGGIIRFTHPLLASGVFSQTTASQRRRLHERLANVVADPDERARHLALGVDRSDALVASAVAEAAVRAARRGAPEAAAALLEHASRLTPPDAVDDVQRRTLDAVDQHIAAGATPRALQLVEEVVHESRAGAIRARALHRLGTICLRAGAFASARAPLVQALEQSGEDLSLRASIERDLGAVLIQDGSVSEALRHARAGAQAAEASGDPVLLAEALDHLCMTEFLCGNGLDKALLERAIALDDQVGTAPVLEHPGPGTGRFPLALTLKWTDRFDAARELFHSLRSEHSERGDVGPLAAVLFHLGELEFWAGNWETAECVAEQGRELASRTGQAGAEARALNLEATIAACRGLSEQTRSKALASIALAEQAHDYLARIRSLKALGVLALSLHDHNAAVEHLERGLELEQRAGYEPSLLRLVPDAIEAFVAVGRVEHAARVTARFDAQGARSGGPWALATAARCRGLIAAANGDLAGARDALALALSRHEQLPQPFELARTHLAMGALQRRLKQKSEARHSLGEAQRIFDILGAQVWSGRARAELARIGGRASSPSALTPTEQRIAEGVAAGGTNREIAAALFLSEKTVESNLTHIYRKLGIESRRDLARRIRAEEQTTRS